MNFPDILKFYSRIDHQILADLQINFSDDLQIAFFKKIVIGKDASCDRILDRHHAAITFFFIGGCLYHIPEGSAGNYFHILAEELLAASW